MVRWVEATIDKLSEDSASLIYTLSWTRFHPEMPNIIERPENLDLMVELAEKIARFIDNPYVRIDFYHVCGKIYFSEAAFYPNAGFCKFHYEGDDDTFGSLIDLSRGASRG